MGNCLFGGLGEAEERGIIRVVTPSGGVMELHPPVAVRTLTDEFPSHGVFRAHDLFWNPLSHHEELVPGESYYLLPYNKSNNGELGKSCKILLGEDVVREGHVRSTSIPAMSSLVTPYRMSLDYQGMLKRSYTDVFSRDSVIGKSSKSGVWKVKLVICPDQLLEILSQDGRTQELIESVQAVAKCGSSGTQSTSGGFSDQWSLSSSRNGSSKADGLLVDI